MRSADAWLRRVAAVALVAGLGACSTVSEGVKSMKEAAPTPMPPTPATTATTATATSAARGASAPAPARVAAAQSDVPVSAAAQRAFEAATASLRAGRTADAERGFRALALSDPDLGGPHANLGVMLRQQGLLDESAAELERAVKLNPRQPVFLNQLGVTYRQQGAFTKSRDAYEQAMSLDPGYAAPVINLGILNDLYLGDGARALELYGRYLALSPSGDAAVTKWVAELKNRKPAPITVSRREKE